MKHLIIILLSCLAVPLLAQTNTTVTDMTFVKSHYGAYESRDSTKVTILNEHTDSTSWMQSPDSSRTQGAYANFFAVGTTDANALVQIQYGIMDVQAKVVRPLRYPDFSIAIDSLMDNEYPGNLRYKKNPLCVPYFYRAIANGCYGATHMRFLVTWGTVTESGTAYLRGQLVIPKGGTAETR